MRSLSFEPREATDQVGESLPVQRRVRYAKEAQCFHIV